MRELFFKEKYDPAVTLLQSATYLPFLTLDLKTFKKLISYLILYHNEYNKRNVNRRLVDAVLKVIFKFISYSFDKYIQTNFSTNFSGLYFNTIDYMLMPYQMDKAVLNIDDLDVSLDISVIEEQLFDTFKNIILKPTTRQVFLYNISFDYDKFNLKILRINIWFFLTASLCVFATELDVMNIDTIRCVRINQLRQNNKER